jgi:hypothetical protein
LQPLVLHLELQECVQHGSVATWVGFGYGEDTFAVLVILVLDEVGMTFELEYDFFGRSVVLGNGGMILAFKPDVGQKITTCPYGFFEAVLENSLVIGINEVHQIPVNQFFIPPAQKFRNSRPAIQDLACGR